MNHIERNRLAVEAMLTERPMDVAVTAGLTPGRLYQLRREVR